MADQKISELVAKTTPVDADLLAIVDSAATPIETKKSTWANIKATLKTYLDTLYEALGAVSTHAALTTGVHGFNKSCKVTHSVNQTIPTNTGVILSFDTTVWDTDNIHDPTNNSRLICKTAGKYILITNLQWAELAAPAGIRIIRFQQNQNPVAEYSFLAGVAYTTTGRPLSTILDLKVNDYADVWVYHTQGGNLDIRATSMSPFFMMARIA